MGLSATMRRLLTGAAAVAIGIGACGAAVAADKAKAAPPQSIWERETLTGDWNGLRTSLKNQGIDITLAYIGEVMSVASGGIDRGTSYEGRFEFSVDTDLQKLIGWTGGSTHFTIFQIHNSRFNVGERAGAIADPSNIDALATTRLFTAWFEQNFNDVVSVRAGQLAADDEFLTSETAGGLINGTFGWAGIMAANITNGGPAYPLAAPGVRVKVNPTANLSVLGAVFAGDPAGDNCFDDPQRCNSHGTTFSTSGGTLWMGEVQYAINQGKQAAGLPGIYKLGLWYATADYADQHFGTDATGATVSLGVDPTADPLQHRGNWGVYGVADQMVWRQGERSLNLFLRGGLVPSDRNLISFYVDGGAGFTGLLAGRPNDVLTFGVAYAKISDDAVAADQDALAFNGPPSFVRDQELVFEVSYAAQIAPWWTVQPDLQYIVHPSGNVADPNDPTTTVKNAFIAGVRSTMKF
jgi:porin